MYGVGFIDISTANRTNPGWEIIRAFQDSPLVHCFMYYDDECYETTETVFRKCKLADRGYGLTMHLFTFPGAHIKAIEYSKSLIGSPYDYTGIVGISIALAVTKGVNGLLRLLNPKSEGRLVWLGNPFHIDQAYFCSEACIGAMKAGGIEVPGYWNSEDISPVRLYKYLEDQGYGKLTLKR